MPEPRPDKFPDWALSDVINGVSGKPNVAEPPPASAAMEDTNEGFKRGGGSIFPKRQTFNWLFRYLGRWIRYFDDVLAGLRVRSYTGLAVHQQTPASMILVMESGVLQDADRTLDAVAQQNTPAFVAPASNSRLDVVWIDPITRLIGVTAGVAAASPVPPAVPWGKYALAIVAIAAAQTSITDASITDVRQGGVQGLLDISNFGNKGKATAGSGLPAGGFVVTASEQPVTNVFQDAFEDGTYLVLSHANGQFTAPGGSLVGISFGLLVAGVHNLGTGGFATNAAGLYNFENALEPTVLALLAGQRVQLSTETTGVPTNPRLFDGSITLVRLSANFF